MAKKYALSYFKPRKCWKKYFKGKTFYLGASGVRKTDEAAYEAALREWVAVKRFYTLEGPTPYEPSGDFHESAYAIRYADFLAEAHSRENLATLSEVRSIEPPENAVFMATNYTTFPTSLPKLARMGRKHVTIDEAVSEFLRQLRARAEAGKVTSKTYAQGKAKLADFLGFAAHHKKSLLSEIDSSFIMFYRETQEQLTHGTTGKQQISAETAKKRLQSLAQLLRLMWKLEHIDGLPRTLDREYTSIKIPPPTPKFWPLDDLRTLFSAASRRTKLYIALGLNCGYTQREIATLEWEMIDKKVVRRKRPKTGIDQVHELWPITLKLLKAESKSDTGLCLRTVDGNPLLTEGIKGNGEIIHNDPIRLAFNRTLKKTGLQKSGLTFKHLRKTSANLIAEKYEDNDLTDLFLAHSQTRAMRRHYAEQHYRKFFETLRYLNSVFKLGQSEKVTGG